jgi:hypothetical protein
MNKHLTPLAFIAFIGLAVPCRAEPVAVPPKIPASAKSEAPESAPAPRSVIESVPASAAASAPLPLLGAAPAVVDPRMGAWRQQWLSPSDALKEGAEVPSWARPPRTPIHCHCRLCEIWKACHRLCGRAECESCH